MNILASYNWIKDHVALKESAEAFARRISLSGPSVERAYPQASAFDGMVVGLLTEVKPHPNADKLRIAAVDVGKRSLEIVCGGSNLAPGMKVAVALVGSKVRWHGQGDLVELKPAEIRGVKSAGMICGANEIGLADVFPHAEREIMDLSWCKAKAGTPLAKALDLDDTVFDIEVTGNRPDAFSMIGLAREASAILGGKFLWKEQVVPSLPRGAKTLPLTVKNQAPTLCTRYQAVVMDDICVGPSPWWVKNRLRMAGIRPINNVVDITNYVMLEVGQPMHAFDHAKLSGQSIVVRQAKAGERLKTLDGREHSLQPSHVVIADAEKPLAVAGVMGGEHSGINEATTAIVFESATFDPVSVRRTGRALNLHSDSSLRYEKGLPEELTSAALARAVELCQKIACGRVASQVFDLDSAPARRNKYAFRPERAEALIGVGVPKKEMAAILKSLGFGVAPKGGTKARPKFEVTVPYWRVRDIEDERDLAEEIARVHGYQNLPSVIPAGTIPIEPEDPILETEERTRHFFRAAGFLELYTYSFVSRDMLERAGLDPVGALKVANELTGDFEFMRPSLIPGALAVIKENQGLFPQGRAFEVSQVYFPRAGELPEQRTNVLAAVYGKEQGDALYRQVKGLLEAYCPTVGAPGVELKRVSSKSGLWHPGRSVEIAVGRRTFGTMGEVHPAALAKFGVDGRVALLDFDLPALMEQCHRRKGYEPVPQFPSVLRDLAFVVPERAEYADVEATIGRASGLLKDAELFDVYRGEHAGEGKKSLALHLTFAEPTRTLTAEEADAEIAKIVMSLKEKFGATVRS